MTVKLSKKAAVDLMGDGVVLKEAQEDVNRALAFAESSLKWFRASRRSAETKK